MGKEDEQRNLATAEALYAATASGDWQAAERLLSDDLVITEASTLPYAGIYQGRGALRELYDKVLASSLGGATISVLGKLSGGNHVAYLLELVPPSGEALQLVEVFHFGEDGKVTEIKPYYFDSDAVNRAVSGA
ncbi:hypothetical protein GCM10010989_05800 [Croceicoccus pelagius]|uniref:SnoaL-like domain-containing protein n=2 Tax=Croceicoccus pelagius TaxID=1703341 RepID=A0A916Y7V2_9SPHN|nr:hypothetical protein GCM10010989_05800 [Croceicoccus pelagius]